MGVVISLEVVSSICVFFNKELYVSDLYTLPIGFLLGVNGNDFLGRGLCIELSNTSSSIDTWSCKENCSLSSY